MQIEKIAMTVAIPVLTGSLTTTSVKVNSVVVEDYETGFDSGIEHNDFQEISFD